MPKIVDRRAYRSTLLDRSVGLFAAHGYDGLTMRQIAEHAGVSTGTLYHYFDSKHDLFQRVVEHQTERLVAQIREASAGPTPRARLESLLRHVAANERWYSGYNRLCLDYLRAQDDRGAGVMAATMTQAEVALAEVLGLTCPAARFALITLFGLVTERDLDGGATLFGQQADFLLEWFDAHVRVV
jgi:AcrR family transcriptional regulator